MTWRNQSGSALIMALIAMGLLGTSVFAGMQIANYLSQESNRTRLVEDAASLNQSIATLIMDPVTCFDGADGTATGLNGVRFENDDGTPFPYRSHFASRPQGQRISIGSHFRDPATNAPLVVRTDTLIPSHRIRITRLLINNVTDLGGGNYSADLRLRAASEKTGFALAEALLTRIQFATDGAGNILSCGPDSSVVVTPAGMCSTMGCSYDPNLEGQKCICPLPPVSCPAGNYISGLSPDLTTATCTPVSVGCSAANQYMVGVDANGSAICAAVTSGSPPAPAPAPGPTPPPPPPTPPAPTYWTGPAACMHVGEACISTSQLHENVTFIVDLCGCVNRSAMSSLFNSTTPRAPNTGSHSYPGSYGYTIKCVGGVIHASESSCTSVVAGQCQCP